MTITLMLDIVILVFTLGMTVYLLSRHYQMAEIQADLIGEIEDIKIEMRRAVKATEHQLNILSGKMAKSHIIAKISEKTAVQSFSLANEAVLRVGALEKSTHKVHFIPADQALAKNGLAKDKIDKLFNPSGEMFDWLEGMDEGEEKEAKD